MSTAIRELGIADAGMVGELLDQLEPLWADALAPASGPMAFVADPTTFVFGAYVDHAVAGWLWGAHTRHPDGRRVTDIHRVAVLEQYRRRGIARSLVEAALGLAQRAGVSAVRAHVDADAVVAAALVESAGARRRVSQDEYGWTLH